MVKQIDFNNVFVTYNYNYLIIGFDRFDKPKPIPSNVNFGSLIMYDVDKTSFIRM